MSASPDFVEPAMEPPTQLYASIKRSSKYHYQQRSKDPFPVHVGGSGGGYCVFGNANQYRIEDLRFYVKVGDRMVALS